MSLAWISVGALVLAVTLSCTTTINVGILSMAMALIVGVFLGGMTPNAVLEGFPTDLMVTLIGVTLLFSIAECNGTHRRRLTGRATRVCRGHAAMLPTCFFAIGFVVATIGAGATPASALLRRRDGGRGPAGIPPLLMAIMTVTARSPARCRRSRRQGSWPTCDAAHWLGGVEWQTFAYKRPGPYRRGVGGFVLLGGWRLFAPRRISRSERRGCRFHGNRATS